MLETITTLCFHVFYPLPGALFSSFLNDQTPVIFHDLVHMSSFLRNILHFFLGMIRDSSFGINCSKIGKYKCLFPLLDHELLRILNSLLSPLCPLHLIENTIQSVLVAQLTKNTGDLAGNIPLGHCGNFTFFQAVI